MLVKELVIKLQKMNQELNVRCWYDGEDNPIKNASSITDVFQINFSEVPDVNSVILTIK